MFRAPLFKNFFFRRRIPFFPPWGFCPTPPPAMMFFPPYLFSTMAPVPPFFPVPVGGQFSSFSASLGLLYIPSTLLRALSLSGDSSMPEFLRAILILLCTRSPVRDTGPRPIFPFGNFPFQGFWPAKFPGTSKPVPPHAGPTAASFLQFLWFEEGFACPLSFVECYLPPFLTLRTLFFYSSFFRLVLAKASLLFFLFFTESPNHEVSPVPPFFSSLMRMGNPQQLEFPLLFSLRNTMFGLQGSPV